MGQFKGFAANKKTQISFGLSTQLYDKTEKIRMNLKKNNRSVVCAAIYEYALNQLLNNDPKILDYLEIKLGLNGATTKLDFSNM